MSDREVYADVAKVRALTLVKPIGGDWQFSEAGWSVADARAQEIADLRTAVASLAVANCKLRQRIAELELASGGAA